MIPASREVGNMTNPSSDPSEELRPGVVEGKKPDFVSQGQRLCEFCKGIDLTSLVTSPPAVTESPPRPTSDYEGDLGVYIDDFSLDRAVKNPNCPLCSFLAHCAKLTGRQSELYDKRCCIRPKLSWSSLAVTGSQRGERASRLTHTGQFHVWFHELKRYFQPTRNRGVGLSSLRKGSETVEEHLNRRRPPPYQQADGPINKEPIPGVFLPIGRRDKPPNAGHKRPWTILTVNSAIASWMVDTVDEAVLTPTRDQKRFPIPQVISLELLSQWMGDCDKLHRHTSEPSCVSSPRIEQLSREGLLRAINTLTGYIKQIPPGDSFVALSYVWGKVVEQQESLVSKPISSYAPTIRDAAYIANGMGFQWLWVDRICIDQTNETEKAALIPYIKDIFSAAQLTIVAASGDGTHTGLPGSRQTPRKAEIVINIPAEPTKAPLALVPAARSFNALHHNCVWRTRGWTLEEQVFSRRLLYVFDTEMIFSCSQGTFRESSANYFSDNPAGTTWGDLGSTPPTIAAELYAKLHNSPPVGFGNIQITAGDFIRAAEEYTGRCLTFERDRVGAFAGLIAAATAPADNVPERALLGHGHPLGYFETALTWQYEHDTSANTLIASNPTSPSWSWASAGTKVHFLDNGDDDSRCNLFHFQLINETDILGLPNRQNHESIAARLRLVFPDNLIQEALWLNEVLSDDPPTYYTANSSILAVTKYLAAGGSDMSLPFLHMVAIVFDALIHAVDDGQHRVCALDNESSSVLGRWSVNPSDRDLCERGGLPQKRKFAVIGGNWHGKIYIMLLKAQAIGSNIFSRSGLIRFSEYEGRPLFDIMGCGDPHWDYICLEWRKAYCWRFSLMFYNLDFAEKGIQSKQT